MLNIVKHLFAYLAKNGGAILSVVKIKPTDYKTLESIYGVHGSERERLAEKAMSCRVV